MLSTQEYAAIMYKTKPDLCKALIEAAEEERADMVWCDRTWHYVKYYADKFFDYQDREVNFLELGAAWGADARVWAKVFPNWTMTFLDISEELEERPADHPRQPGKGRVMPEGVPVYIGDQKDETILRTLVKERGPFDIILDDASHYMEETWASFTMLFDWGLKSPGLYMLEDLGTSYWPSVKGAGIRQPGTVIENIKDLVEPLNYVENIALDPVLHSEGGPHPTRRLSYERFKEMTIDLDRTITEISFQPSMACVYKGNNWIEERHTISHPHEEKILLDFNPWIQR